MTQVEDRAAVGTAAPVADPVVEDVSRAGAPTTDSAWPAVVIATPRPLFTAVVVAGSLSVAVATATAVAETTPLTVAAAGVAWTVWLVLLVATSRRRLRVEADGIGFHDGLRRRQVAWTDVERVEITSAHRLVRHPRLVLRSGRRVPLPPAATWAPDGVVSPVDRIAALAGEAGVPVATVPSRRGFWVYAVAVVLGVLAGLAVGVAVAAALV